MAAFPNLSLVIGAAASGKSAWAETLVRQYDRPKFYIATAEIFDPEMQRKITRHQQRRGGDWASVEAPIDLPRALLDVAPKAVVLVDCLTMWLSNLLMADSDLAKASDELCVVLDTLTVPVVMVTNEVGASIVPENALARRFQAEQGLLNQKIAAQADLVVSVIAGLPLVLKGVLPEGVQ